jgi:glucose/arabinose dehydrogenase
VLAFTLIGISINAKADSAEYQIDELIQGLKSPWSLAFLPSGDMLITELGGNLRRVRDGELLAEPVNGLPKVYYQGQGGLMDVVVDRNFSQNQTIYLSFSFGDKAGNATRLISAVINDNQLENIQVLFTASPLKQTPHHYAGRIAQLQDGSLLLTVGDGYNYREQAQKLDSHLGKIIRVMPNGEVPADNPWVSAENAKPEIWSIGHRNMQAIVVAPDGSVYSNEHGPQGGDEINIIRPGMNYGWPVITQGIDYNFASISPYKEYPGMLQPLVDWTPSIAPAGMTYYTGSQFPQWQGDLFVVSLAEKSVRRIDLNEGLVVSDQRIFKELDQRMRDIRTGPDGAIYILTDGEEGKLLKVSARN